MQLDWRIRLLDWLLKRQPPVHTKTPEQIQHANLHPPTGILAWIFLGQPPALHRVRDMEIPGRHGKIPIRLYYPQAERGLPLVMFFHGGGWVTNKLEIHDVICRQIALSANAIVAAVDYRLAPQYRFPIPLEDCYDATCWLAEQR
ncbi:MAG: alpha/beta hydrolase, partial [Cyanobacteria bacterium J06641_5]